MNEVRQIRIKFKKMQDTRQIKARKNMLILQCIIFMLLHSKICINALSGPGPLCLSCDKVVKPRDCSHVTVCGEHESCGVELFVTSSGIQFYKVGCKADTICSRKKREIRSLSGGNSICLDCCKEGQLCNRKGCGASDFVNNGGKVCYGCDQHSKPDTCDDITLCGRDQDCFISIKTVGTDILYTSGCRSKYVCNELHDNYTCSHCCGSPLCNDNCHRTSITTGTAMTTTTQTSISRTIETKTKVTPSSTKSTVTNTTLPSCPEGPWYTFQNSKYCLHSSIGQHNWTSSTAICKNHLTHLPIVETDEEMRFIDSIIRNINHDVWLDGTDIAIEGYWIWNTTGNVIEHAMWNVGQPDNYFGKHSENCLEYGPDYAFKWNDAPCNRTLSVLCEWSAVDTTKEDIPDCVTSWKIEDFRMFCDVYQQTNWHDAQAICKNLHAHLPIIESADKQTLMDRLVGDNEIWLDGTEEGHINTWKWSSSGQTITYDNWLKGEPNDFGGIPEYCMEYGKRYGWQWNDAPCTDNQRTTKIICERYIPNLIVG